MNLQSQQELDSTREKLRLLERRYDAIRREEDVNDRATSLTLQSLKALINQLKEEITRFEGRTAARHESN
jgi:flagellar biosynthesis chaperone FliJ